MTSGAVAIIYNLTGIASGQIKLTGDVLAKIYLKTITNWNDPQITALNPGLNLPNTPIAVVHRSDGSGTTYIFTNYLSKVSADWSTKVGNATQSTGRGYRRCRRMPASPVRYSRHPVPSATLSWLMPCKIIYRGSC